MMIVAGADIEMLHKTYGRSGYIFRLRNSSQFRHSQNYIPAHQLPNPYISH
jgi:hypothetical protein